MGVGASVKAEQAIAAFDGPRQGISRNVPFHEIAPDALYESLNVVWREGSLQARPGLTSFDTTDLGTRPTGAYPIIAQGQAAFQDDAFQNDAFQVTDDSFSVSFAVGTNEKFWAYYSGAYNDLTNTALNGTADHLARFTSIEIASVLYVLLTNGIDPPQVWDQSAGTVADVGGSPPIFTDWCTASDRVVGIVPPFTVQWGNSLDITTWAANNVRVLSDTPDIAIAIRNLGTLGFIVWKQRTLWVGLAQGGLNSAYFRFELRGFFEGPAGVSAIVDADGVQYWMTATGRVGAFDGVQQKWVAEGIYPLMRDDVDAQYMGRAFGVYNPTFREVYFYYPRAGDDGEVMGCVIITVPRPEEGILRHGAFWGRLSVPVSAGMDLRITTHLAYLFTADTFQTYTLEGARDDTAEFSGFWQTGVQRTPDGNLQQLGGIATLVERGAGYGELQASALTSRFLETPGGTRSPTVLVTLEPENAPWYPDGPPPNQQGRFFGLRYDFETPITLRYRGAYAFKAPDAQAPLGGRAG